MHRDDHLSRVHEHSHPFDLIIIGGGASGLGTALDAATRGLDVLLLEATDFGKGTSSRSTKLIHGGVRYLQQGNLSLVRESLHERSRLMHNASHVVHPLEFILPCRSRFESWYYGLGMKLYDWLADKNEFQPSRKLSRDAVIAKLPAISPNDLFAGISYFDGQFDDARLLVSLAQTAAQSGATIVNAARVTELTKSSGRITGVVFRDEETQDELHVRGQCVVNTTGPFCDSIRRLDDSDCRPLVAASQGIHLVLPEHFFPGSTALIVPRTSDGRVMFIIPWHRHVLLGTTDTPVSLAEEEPRALETEIDFLLNTAADYVKRPPSRSDCLSVFAGIRPLVKGTPNATTKSLARDHTIEISASGLITMTGGKWTTYRQMAEDCVDRVLGQIGCHYKTSQTHDLRLCGHPTKTALSGPEKPPMEDLLSERPELAQLLHAELPYQAVEVVRAVRHEWARSIEDVLARRTRALFLNARAAIAAGPLVAKLMAEELGRDTLWQSDQIQQFQHTASKFIVCHDAPSS
jgi:glycerol-3-phosphate dehydrogenase